jgi:ATP-dependent Clp protease ATP-binding subunit ClpA
LGLVTLNNGVGDTVLKSSGLSVESIERYLSSKCVASEEAVEQEGVVFGRSATDALSRAEQEAGRFRHSILGVEHLALSLLAEERGEAADLFTSAKVERDKLRQTILYDMNR